MREAGNFGLPFNVRAALAVPLFGKPLTLSDPGGLFAPERRPLIFMPHLSRDRDN
jgi:hypothetical protein